MKFEHRKTVRVELTEREAQYVEFALFKAYVNEADHGGVWLPFANGLMTAGIRTMDNPK